MVIQALDALWNSYVSDVLHIYSQWYSPPHQDIILYGLLNHFHNMVYVIGCQSGQDCKKVGDLGRALWSMVWDEIFCYNQEQMGSYLETSS